MQFPPEFFKAEYRDGYYVSEMMKHTWAVQMEMAEAVGLLCQKYGLRYYIISGTLLGAVREGGFIPWDDDIDLLMLRSDYMKLLQHADELPEPYWILSIYSSEEFYYFHAVVKNNRGRDLITEEDRKKLFNGCPFVVGIDIFPQDNIFDDENKRELQRLLYRWSYSLLYKVVALEDKQKEGKEITEEEQNALSDELAEFAEKLSNSIGDTLEFDDSVPLKNGLSKLADGISMMAADEESTLVCKYSYVPALPLNKKVRGIPRAVYEEAIDIPFEFTSFPAPKRFHEALVENYGPDYMTPVKYNAQHDYPCYRGQSVVFGYMIEVEEFEKRQLLYTEAADRSDRSFNATGYAKKILYFISVESLMTEGDRILSRIGQLKEIAEKQKDYLYWWLIVDGTWSDVLNECMPELIGEYRTAIDEIESAGIKNIFVDRSGDYHTALVSCDEFYGDEGIVAALSRQVKKPVIFYEYTD